jgi:hypothetical protein
LRQIHDIDTLPSPTASGLRSFAEGETAIRRLSPQRFGRNGGTAMQHLVPQPAPPQERVENQRPLPYALMRRMADRVFGRWQ